MATCCIFRSMLSEGFSSGLGAPACKLRLPRRLGSFWGFSFPMSQTSTYRKIDVLRVRTIKQHALPYYCLGWPCGQVVTLVARSQVQFPCVAVRLVLSTALGMWIVTIKLSTVFPMVCLGPIVTSRRPQGPDSKKLMLCFTYTGMATRLGEGEAMTINSRAQQADNNQLVFTS